MFSKDITTILGFNGVDPSKVEKIIGRDDDNYFRVIIEGKIYRLMYTDVQYPVKLPKLVSASGFKINKEDLIEEVNYDLISKDMKITYIISYRENDNYRRRNLEAVLTYVSKLEIKNLEILLVEQDIIEKFDCSKYPKVRKIFLYNPNIFNKGWGYNVGALNAKGNYLIFGDSDIILPYKYIINSLNMFTKYDVVDPYIPICYLNEHSTQMFINNNYNISNIEYEKQTISGVISGGIFMIRKKKFLDLKGFDEECFGYGHEDDIFDMKLRIMEYKIKRIENQFCFHLFHQKSTPSYYDNKNKNQNLSIKYNNLTKNDLINTLESTKQIGNIKKHISDIIEDDNKPLSLFKKKKKIKLFNFSNKKPISIIITAYQSQNYIEECLDSIEKQTYFDDNDNFEVLVGVDDCHKTLRKLLEIKHKYRNIRIFMMDSNMGTYVTSNTLLDFVEFDNIIRFDSDDVMKPEMVEEIFNISDDYDIVRFCCYSFEENIKNINTNTMRFPDGVIFYKKKILDLVGGYRDWRCAADSELLKRIDKFVSINKYDKFLFYRRSHDNSLTKRDDTKFGSVLRKTYKSQIREYQKNENIKINKIVNTYVEF